MSTSISRVIGVAFLDHDFAIGRQISRKLSAFEQLINALIALFAQNTNFVFKVASQAIFFLLNRQRTRVFS